MTSGRRLVDPETLRVGNGSVRINRWSIWSIWGRPRVDPGSTPGRSGSTGGRPKIGCGSTAGRLRVGPSHPDRPDVDPVAPVSTASCPGVLQLGSLAILPLSGSAAALPISPAASVVWMRGSGPSAQRCIFQAARIESTAWFCNSVPCDTCSSQAASIVRRINNAAWLCNPSALPARETQNDAAHSAALQTQNVRQEAECNVLKWHPSLLNQLG